MKRITYIVALLIVTVFPAYAEVFKCKQASGKVLYQSAPCSSGVSAQEVVRVEEMTPEQRETAKQKLRSWEERQAIEEAEKVQAEKDRQEELRKQESLELQRRSVAAQEQQAIATQQQQNQGNGVGFYDPYYRRYNRFPYDSRNPDYFPRPHPHNPAYPVKPDMPPLPPPQPVKPGPIHMKNTDGKDSFGFK